MPERVTIDEIHLTLSVPNDLSEEATVAIHTVLTRDEFMDRLGRAVRAVLRGFSELNPIRVSLTR